jgi:diguanylate cyclase (GGDEF)-like protein
LNSECSQALDGSRAIGLDTAPARNSAASVSMSASASYVTFASRPARHRNAIRPSAAYDDAADAAAIHRSFPPWTTRAGRQTMCSNADDDTSALAWREPAVQADRPPRCTLRRAGTATRARGRGVRHQSFESRTVQLRRLFLVLSCALSVTVIAMTVSVVGSAWEDLREANAGLAAMQQLQAALVVAEMASRERGPANGVLGDDLPGDPAKIDRLRAFRQKTDAAFDALEHMLATGGASSKRVREMMQGARRQLALAREAVDAEARKARSARRPTEIREAVTQMFEVIEDITPATIKLTNDATATFPVATNSLVAARQAAVLREYAGRLGSLLTAPLALRQRLTLEDRAAIDQMRGRIEQLRQQLSAFAAAAAARPPVRAAIDNMQTRYFGKAIPFVEEETAIGMRDGRYDVDTAQFAARYVPDMDSIVTLRDVLMGDATDDARHGLAHARNAALLTAAGGALTLFLLGLTLLLLHRRVIRPLATTTELIVTIAQGNLDIVVPRPRFRDEVANILGAIAILRDNSIARREAENAIRQMAHYDGLTGLPNRRLLEDRMDQVLASARRRGTKVAVLFIDLDKFKQVNDQRGHEAGDWLLKQVANRMRAALRESDTASRVGGDEFVVLLPDTGQLEDAVNVARKIREQMERPFAMEDGTVLEISCSIGVAMYPDQANEARDLLRFGDDAMYVAKKNGRNAVAVFGANPDTPSPELAPVKK